MRYTRSRILLMSFVLEGILVLTFFVWARLRNVEFDIIPAYWELGYGFLFCLPLFVLNYLLFGPASRKYSFLRTCYDFKDRVVRPLADELDVVGSAAVSLCAGIGEELFFRGVLQSEWGIVAGAVCFSVLHFGTAAKRYFALAVLYALIGCYFGLLAEQFHSLYLPISAHAAYDFLALMYLKFGDKHPN